MGCSLTRKEYQMSILSLGGYCFVAVVEIILGAAFFIAFCFHESDRDNKLTEKKWLWLSLFWASVFALCAFTLFIPYITLVMKLWPWWVRAIMGSLGFIGAGLFLFLLMVISETIAKIMLAIAVAIFIWVCVSQGPIGRPINPNELWLERRVFPRQ